MASRFQRRTTGDGWRVPRGSQDDQHPIGEGTREEKEARTELLEAMRDPSGATPPKKGPVTLVLEKTTGLVEYVGHHVSRLGTCSSQAR